jgi:hypothetical protein
MVPGETKTAQGRRPEERPQGVVRDLADARAERQAAKSKEYMDVSWPDPPYGISDPGYQYFKEEVQVFIQNLMNSARVIAREADLESISTIHVKKALKLFSNKPQTRRSKIFEISGGLLAGASISLILAGTLAGSSLAYQAVVCIAGFAGTLLIGVSLKDV